MMKHILIIFISLIFIFIADFTQAQTVVYGKLTDEASGESLSDITIDFYTTGQFKYSTQTDSLGNYAIHLAPGTYRLFMHDFLLSQELINVLFLNNSIHKLNIPIHYQGRCIGGYSAIGYKIPLIKFDQTSNEETIDHSKIIKAPQKTVEQLTLSVPGISNLNF